MAQIYPTVTPPRHVLGDLVVRLFTLTGVSGDNFVVPFTNIVFISVQPGSVITATAITKLTSGGSLTGQSKITLTSSGAYTNEVIMVWGTSG
jgi:hypothetical protein